LPRGCPIAYSRDVEAYVGANDSGSLSETPFPLLLVDLYSRRATGCLEVGETAHCKRVYMEEGRVVFAASKSRNDRLGEMLLRRGTLRLADYCRAASSIIPGKRFGTVLVEMGLLTPHDLVGAVKEQVKEIVFSLFPVTGTPWALSGDSGARDEIIKLNINTPELIKQGISRLDRVDLILGELGDPGRLFSLTLPLEDVEESLALGDWERDLAGRLASPQRLEVLLGLRDQSDFEAMRLLWTLLTLRMMAPVLSSDPTAMGTTSGEDLEISGEDLAAFGNAPPPRPPAPSPTTAPGADADACMEALGEVTRYFRGELGSSTLSFVGQAFEKQKLLAAGDEVPALRLLPTMEWAGALTTPGQIRFVRRFLTALCEQAGGLLPEPTARAMVEVCRRLERP
jgi:hypothetical protein